MGTLKDKLDAPYGMALWLPGDTEARVNLSFTETACKRQLQRTIKTTETSYQNVPAFGQVKARPYYQYNLNIAMFMIEYLALEQLVWEADTLLTGDTQQYLLLYDSANRIDITARPEYAVSVIDPLDTLEVDGHSYAFCVLNVWVAEYDVDRTTVGLEEVVNVSLTLNEVW